jgi:GT2 family glycosyltransferase
MAGKIVHIPRVLYHWRVHSASTADNPASKLYAYEAGKKAIEGNLARCGEEGTVTLRSDYGFYDVDYKLRGTPLVSILIPNKDQADTLRTCLESIKKKCMYPSYEILIIENNSTEEATFSYYKELEAQGIRVLKYPKQGFNYSAINNFGVKEAKGEYLLFLNNDMEIITPDFMEKMVSNLQRPQIGAVGAKLYYPDNTVQHAGIIIGIGGIAGHAFLGLARGRSGYLHKASLQMNVSAVTAACMMMKKEVFEEVGGFEEELSVAFNDVDLCLRIGKAGYKIVYNPHVELYHYESKSRGAEDDEKKVRRFQSEIEFMRSRWIGLLKAGDPCYNPNLTLASWNYGLRADGRGVKPWTK